MDDEKQKDNPSTLKLAYELSGLSERVTKVETNQAWIIQNFQNLEEKIDSFDKKLWGIIVLLLSLTLGVLFTIFKGAVM